jgi:hypothetical protein
VSEQGSMLPHATNDPEEIEREREKEKKRKEVYILRWPLAEAPPGAWTFVCMDERIIIHKIAWRLPRGEHPWSQVLESCWIGINCRPAKLSSHDHFMYCFSSCIDVARARPNAHPFRSYIYIVHPR